MGLLSWLIVGLVAGALAGMATGSRDQGCLGTIAVGVLGAFIGGALFRWGTGDDADFVSELSLSSVLVAFVGAVVLLLVLRILGVNDRRRRR